MMAINYDFIAYCCKLSTDTWKIGMKAIQGEVPLDIVIPEQQYSEEEIVGVLNTEGIVRESSDAVELIRYLRELNAKPNDDFGYNDLVIRNVHTRLINLKVNQEIRVQITYSERKGHYSRYLYQIKMLGIFPHIEAAEEETSEHEDYATHTQPVQQREMAETAEKPPYKTTNTLEKLINFAQNLQRELKQTQKSLSLMADRVEQLEEERQSYRELRNMVQDILDHLNQLETFDERIKLLEIDRQQLHALQQTLQTFLKASNQLTQMLMKENADNLR